jgi:exopolysaccharide production protein ExoQ
MPPFVATLGCTALIAGLFWLNRDRTVNDQTSPALWLPVIWTFLGASRMASQWLGVEPIDAMDLSLEGSPFDRLVLIGFLLAGFAVLAVRSERVGALLRANMWLLVFFCYCAVSVLWSDFPFVAVKRLTKGIGNLTMVLIVLSDPRPAAAIRRFFAWSGFLLIPLSVLLIKYYPALGRVYNRWTWEVSVTGVASDKNGLGAICLLVGLASFWRFIEERRQPAEVRPRGPQLAHLLVLVMVAWLFSKADSSTALACFLLGAGVIVMTTRVLGDEPARVHGIVATIGAAILLVALFPNGFTYVVQALGRNTTLTGRTDIWGDLLGMDFNRWLGTGFESFWLGERADMLARKYYFHPNQAHNGYIEMYVNLGLVGLGFLVLLMLKGYARIVDAYRSLSGLSTLRLAIFVVAAVYNITEATFKVMHPVWIMFLLVIALPPPEDRDEDAISAS